MTTWLARSRRCGAWLVLVVLFVVVANYPVTTKQGVNSEVSLHRLPLYLKSFEFVSRDAQYRQLASEIAHGTGSSQDRALAVFDWTARRVQPSPETWPVVDDHILNIIIRGYGMSDQRADVFATLATYAGVPAFWQKIQGPGAADGVIFTFVQIDSRWVVMDVANGFIFWNTSGQLATPDDLSAGRVMLPEAAKPLMIGTTPYSQILRTLRMPPIPGTLRAELQMPGPRLWYQTKRAIGWGRDDGTEQ